MKTTILLGLMGLALAAARLYARPHELRIPLHDGKLELADLSAAACEGIHLPPVEFGSGSINLRGWEGSLFLAAIEHCLRRRIAHQRFRRCVGFLRRSRQASALGRTIEADPACVCGRGEPRSDVRSDESIWSVSPAARRCSEKSRRADSRSGLQCRHGSPDGHHAGRTWLAGRVFLLPGRSGD